MKIISNMHWALSLPMTAKPSHAEILLSVQMRRCFHSNPVKIFIAIAKQSLHLSLLNINIVKHSALLVRRSKSQTSCGCCCTEGPPPHCTEAALHSTTSVSPPRAKGTQNEGGEPSHDYGHFFTEVSWISWHSSDWKPFVHTRNVQLQHTCLRYFWSSIE